MNWFSSDLHLGHTNIIRYCDRPFKDVDEMDETLIKNWNEKIAESDTVFVLGDVAFTKDKLALVSTLHGKKILIRGNHDKGFSDTKFINAGFDTIHKKPYFFIHIKDSHPIFVNCCHAPDKKYLRQGMLNLCGHVHEKWKFEKGFINVGVDQWNFYPVSYQDLLLTYRKVYPRRHLTCTVNTDFYQIL